MTTMLRIDASPRVEGSHSRSLADELTSRWMAAHPDGTVVVRDLATDPVPHVTQDMLAAIMDPEYRNDPGKAASAALSDELIAQLKAADELVIATPMYNFTVPSGLKAWIDNIVRHGETFAVSDQGEYTGLLKTKKAWVVLSSGGTFSEGPFAAHDHLGPYLEGLLRFLGVADVTVLRHENTEFTPEMSKMSRDKAVDELRAMLGEA